MSKTIHIPEYNNPFTVNINNKEYVYRGGDTIEVPDEVAEAIEDALALEPKPKRYLSKFDQLLSGSLDEIETKDLEGISRIRPYAFYKYNHGITGLTIPNNITLIGEYAFFGCNNLESIRFGSDSKLETIEGYAFNWCGKLTRVYLPTMPPTLIAVNAFSGINTTCIFYCKTQASLDAYKAAPNWSTLTGTYSFVVEE